MLGAGDRQLESRLAAWSERAKGRIAVHVGYDEGLSHRVESAADFLLMPSRFEPCGLNQMYSQRYGTIPVVRRTGGLADTVVDRGAGATGIHFDDADAGGIAYGVDRALALMRRPEAFRAVQRAGMEKAFDWASAAGAYLDLYERVRPTNPA